EQKPRHAKYDTWPCALCGKPAPGRAIEFVWLPLRRPVGILQCDCHACGSYTIRSRAFDHLTTATAAQREAFRAYIAQCRQEARSKGDPPIGDWTLVHFGITLQHLRDWGGFAIASPPS